MHNFFLQEVSSGGILSCNMFHLVSIILRLRFTLFSNKLLINGILFFYVDRASKVDLVGISFRSFSIAFLCIMTIVIVVTAFL